MIEIGGNSGDNGRSSSSIKDGSETFGIMSLFLGVGFPITAVDDCYEK